MKYDFNGPSIFVEKNSHDNVVCTASKASDQPAYMRSLIRAFASCIFYETNKLLTEHHLEFLSFKGDSTCSSESILVKMPHVAVQQYMSYV